MKVGDKVPVTIAGQKVADAEVRAMADGTVTLVFPATKVVMGTRTEIAPEVTGNTDTGSDHQILGVEQNGVPVTDAPVAEEVAAPVGEQAQSTNNAANEQVQESGPVDATAPNTITSEAANDAQQQAN